MCLLDVKQKKTHIISGEILPKALNVTLNVWKQLEKSGL